MSEAQIKFDRQMLRAQLDRGTELLMLLESTKTDTISDEEIIPKIQALIDAGTLDYYFSIIAFCQALVKAGKCVVPQVTRPGIVIPKGTKTH